MKSGDDPSKKDEKMTDEAHSPSVSEKQSESKGAESGSQSGGGQKGGGQKANQPGKGSAGSHNPADDNGGQTSEEKGPGEIGNTPGEDAKSKKPTGGESKKSSNADQGAGEKQPGGDGKGAKQSDDNSPGGTPMQNPPDGGAAAGNKMKEGPGARGSGNPTVGGNPNNQPEAEQPPPAEEPGGDAANLDYARKQSELALKHLDEEMAKDKSDLLERLGWSKEDAKRFLDRWQQLRRDARDSGPKGKEAKKDLDDALKSLGLRPRTTQIDRGSTSRDRMRDLRDAGRFAPPADWAEQFREYQRSVPEPKK